MAVVLGALIFAALTGGLSLLMAIPALFVVLGIGVFKEGRQIAQEAKARAAATAWPETWPAAEPSAEPERLRTRAAGRRA